MSNDLGQQPGLDLPYVGRSTSHIGAHTGNVTYIDVCCARALRSFADIDGGIILMDINRQGVSVRGSTGGNFVLERLDRESCVELHLDNDSVCLCRTSVSVKGYGYRTESRS